MQLAKFLPLTAALTLVSGCYGDPDKFNEKRAKLLCKANDNCSEDGVRFTEVPYSGCESNETELFSACPDVCEYSQETAQDCIKAVRRIKRTCEVTSDHDVCEHVYQNCEFDDDDTEDCDATPTEYSGDTSCSIGGTRGIAPLILILLIRRRRKNANRS